MAFDRILFKSAVQKTVKLFHADPWRSKATARVIALQDEYVVLDQTIFYAESGGQEFDTGTINGYRVIDVQDQGGHPLYSTGSKVRIPSIKVDTVIVHRLEGCELFGLGQEVSIEIDWSRRHNLMKSHSAAHFVFYAAQQVLNAAGDPLFVKGCHIAEDTFRFDFSVDCSASKTAEIEALANELMRSGGVIKMVPSEVSDEVFYWTWRDVIIPCGGTHVEDASTLPVIKLSRSKKGSSITRVKASFSL